MPAEVFALLRTSRATTAGLPVGDWCEQVMERPERTQEEIARIQAYCRDCTKLQLIAALLQSPKRTKDRTGNIVGVKLDCGHENRIAVSDDNLAAIAARISEA
jgi:hypothetical protein